MIGLCHPEPGRILTEIRDAALDYVGHGWAVQPGTYQVAGSSTWHGARGATTLEPIADNWWSAGITDVGFALEAWTRRPYSILMACGVAFDAIEVPVVWGRQLTGPLRAADCLPPTIVSPFGTQILLVAPGEISLSAVAPADTVVHGADSWIVLPSTADAYLGHRWRLHPRAVGWQVPEAHRVQRVIADCVTPTPHRAFDRVGLR